MPKTNIQKWIAYMRKNPPTNLPPQAFSTDAGKVLSVDSSGKPIWIDAPIGLPAVTSQDTNKVLVTDSSGVPSWGTVMGGEIPLADDEGLMIYKLPTDN